MQRRGRLHKRQLENADGDEVSHGGKAPKLNVSTALDGGKSISKDILEETDYYFENGTDINIRITEFSSYFI